MTRPAALCCLPLALAAPVFAQGDAGKPRPRPVAFTFTLVNAARRTVTYAYPTAQQFDVAVGGPQGRQVWDWARGRAFAPTATRITLAPGQRKSYQADWDGLDAQGRPAAPGFYTVTARVTAGDRPSVTGGFGLEPDGGPGRIGLTLALGPPLHRPPTHHRHSAHATRVTRPPDAK